MQKRYIHKWLLTAWFMLLGCTLSVVSGQQYGSPYKQASNRPVTHPSIQNNPAPAYRFQSTSSINSVVGNNAYVPPVNEPFAASIKSNSPLRRSWDDPDDEGGSGEGGIAVIPNPSPIGGPLVLFVMALLYLLWRKYTLYATSEKERR